MSVHSISKLRCQVCGETKNRRELIPVDLLRESTMALIQKKTESWDPSGFVCFRDLNEFRTAHIQKLLADERGELSEVERRVIDSLHEQDVLSADLNRQFDGTQTFGEKISDKVASFGGSWKFIISFSVSLAIWMSINVWLDKEAFDPFPFIFLNLILSCIAAVQAPVIMMSQNRQEAKDRLRSEHDYKVNLKAELEIRNLTTKVDLLISHQWQHLLEIQQIQTDMMNEMLRSLPKNK